MRVNENVNCGAALVVPKICTFGRLFLSAENIRASCFSCHLLPFFDIARTTALPPSLARARAPDMESARPWPRRRGEVTMFASWLEVEGACARLKRSEWIRYELREAVERRYANIAARRK